MDVAHRVGQYAWHLQSPVRRDVNDHFVRISTAAVDALIASVAVCQSVGNVLRKTLVRDY